MYVKEGKGKGEKGREDIKKMREEEMMVGNGRELAPR